MNIAVIGGLGRIGLVLSATLARKHTVHIIDINDSAKAAFRAKRALFDEKGLNEAIDTNYYRMKLANIVEDEVEAVFVATNNNDIESVIQDLGIGDRLLLIRQTVSVGTTNQLRSLGYRAVYTPERLAQGKGMSEILEMPQIIGSDNDDDLVQAMNIFDWVRCIPLTSKEAELSKLFCNYYRAGTFALANDMKRLANKYDANFARIRSAVMKDYPRMSSFPNAGVTGGYCLPKDTKIVGELGSKLALQVYDANYNVFTQIREKIYAALDDGKSVGVLGLTAKANNDDLRHSVLSEVIYEVESNIDADEWENPTLITYDPYVDGHNNMKLLLKALMCDVVLITIPHAQFMLLESLGFFRDISGEVINYWE